MKISDKQIWQMGAGDVNRNHARLCLNWGVILNGPGYIGEWSEQTYHPDTGQVSANKRTDLRKFCEEMKPGDIVVLRVGLKTAYGVGEIVGDYEWSDAFGDVDGWNIQHVRRVKWLWARPEDPKRFANNVFTRGTTHRMTSKEGLSWLRSLKVHTTKEITLPKLPDAPKTYGSIDEIFDDLYEKGVDGTAVSRLSRDFTDLVRLAAWYDKNEIEPSEHETVSYLVIPFLRAIGWTPQRMAVEWNRVDVALFQTLPRDEKNLRFVVEAKKMGRSCLTAQSQAAKYADDHDCRDLVVTDGIRYGVYSKSYGSFRLVAYFNLLRLRDAYPVLNSSDQSPVGGAKDAIWRMTPEYSA